jgi:hypothetical protein
MILPSKVFYKTPFIAKLFVFMDPRTWMKSGMNRRKTHVISQVQLHLPCTRVYYLSTIKKGEYESKRTKSERGMIVNPGYNLTISSNNDDRS